MTSYLSTLHRPTFDLPLSGEFIALITAHLVSLPDTCQGIMLNFHGPEYSVKNGGWCPARVHLICSGQPEIWQLGYLADFNWRGHVRPELVKGLDISWPQRYTWHCLVGELPINHELSEFWALWQDNFMAYYAMDALTIAVPPNY